jgi:hypothetical protein
LAFVLRRLLHLTLELRRETLPRFAAADDASKRTADGGQQGNDLRSVFEGEVQTLPIKAGARTVRDTTPNFTFIPDPNKAICWQSRIGNLRRQPGAGSIVLSIDRYRGSSASTK